MCQRIFEVQLLMSSSSDDSGTTLVGHLLDDTYSDDLIYVSDGETTKRSVGGESHDDHSLGWAELDHDSILGLDFLGLTPETTHETALTGLSPMHDRENQPLTD